MTTFFSITSRGFYPDEMRAEYDVAGTWPGDAVAVDTQTESALRTAIETGSTISVEDGSWTIIPPPLPSFESLASPYLDSVRKIRDGVLNRLAGIGFAAMVASDMVTVNCVLQARSGLLDITSAPPVVAAKDMDELSAAVHAVYLGILNAAPQNIRDAFDPGAL